MKKIVSVVLNNFTHDSRVLKEAVSAKKAGYDVVVLALHDVGLPEAEVVSGVRVRRIRVGGKRLVPHLKGRKFFPLRLLCLGFIYLEFWLKALSFCKGVDLVHCNDLETLPIGCLAKLRCKCGIVYDTHEYTTEQGFSGLRLFLIKRFERILIKYADRVLTVSDSIADEYVRLYQIEKPALVLNCPSSRGAKEDQDYFRIVFPIEAKQAVFLYQGGFTSGRGIEVLLKTFEKIAKEPPFLPLPVIVFMGYGALEGLIKESAERTENIFLHSAVSPSELLGYTASADFGILFYENTCLNHYYCSPNKMFEYLMAGIPVIVSNLYEMKRIVKEYGVGVYASQNNTQGLETAICEVLEKDAKVLGENISAAKKIYTWENQEKVLLAVYKGVLNE